MNNILQPLKSIVCGLTISVLFLWLVTLLFLWFLIQFIEINRGQNLFVVLNIVIMVDSGRVSLAMNYDVYYPYL